MMQKLLLCESSLLVAMAVFTGCSSSPKAPDVADNVRKALTGPAFKDISVDQDRTKSVVTLKGHVASNDDKSQAEAIARPIVGNEVLADEIAVLPPGSDSDAKRTASDFDKGIENNLDAALVQNKLHGEVKYSVSQSVVTLTGDVDSPSKRMAAQRIAAAVPNVTQVVNELQVKDQKATSQD